MPGVCFFTLSSEVYLKQGGADYWYPRQQKFFPGLLFSPSPSPQIKRGPIAVVSHPLRWRALSEENGAVTIIHESSPNYKKVHQVSWLFQLYLPSALGSVDASMRCKSLSNTNCPSACSDDMSQGYCILIQIQVTAICLYLGQQVTYRGMVRTATPLPASWQSPATPNAN